MYSVVKRDGQIVGFDINKIADAIKKAFEATKTVYTESVIDFLALKVTADFLPKIHDGLVTVEDIQDSVETVLARGGYEMVGKAYILYRKQREKMRNLKSTYLDYRILPSLHLRLNMGLNIVNSKRFLWYCNETAFGASVNAAAAFLGSTAFDSNVSAELGRTSLMINELLQLGQGSVVELNKLAGEPLEIYVNGKLVARGEAVVINEKFGVRLTDIISPIERVKQLG